MNKKKHFCFESRDMNVGRCSGNIDIGRRVTWDPLSLVAGTNQGKAVFDMQIERGEWAAGEHL